MNRKQLIFVSLAAIAALAVAAASGWYVGARNAASPAAPATESGRKVLFWHDPMYPGTKFDKPGKSPFMDMDLVPVYEDGAAAGGATAVITVRPEVVSTLGVRTHKVEWTTQAHRTSAEGYLVADQRGLRVLLDSFDRDAGWLRAGLPAEVRILDLPGQRFEAAVESVTTDVDVGARSMKATLRLKQSDPALKPGMFAAVSITAGPTGKKLSVPREALIRTATRMAVVLALGEGRFQPVPVVAGAEYGESVEILQGLKDGDVVVTSGQFLLDSDASLHASFQRMETPAASETEKKP